MFNYITTHSVFYPVLEKFKALQAAEMAAKTLSDAAEFPSAEFETRCNEWAQAERQRRAYYANVVTPLFKRMEIGKRTLTGRIDGSELNYREAKENVTAPLELVKSRETDCHERAWAARWLRGAQRFPSLAGHLIPALKEAHGWFVAAVAVEEIKDCRGMYRTLRRMVDEDQTETGVEAACAEFRRAMREQGVTGDATDLFAQFDVLHLLGVNPF